MANYVENIKVGSGESWPVRDAEAQASIEGLMTLFNRLSGETADAQGEILNLQKDIATMIHTVQSSLPLTGGTLTGPLMFTEGVHYGDELPDAGNVGRIFFKKVNS